MANNQYGTLPPEGNLGRRQSLASPILPGQSKQQAFVTWARQLIQNSTLQQNLRNQLEANPKSIYAYLDDLKVLSSSPSPEDQKLLQRTSAVIMDIYEPIASRKPMQTSTLPSATSPVSNDFERLQSLSGYPTNQNGFFYNALMVDKGENKSLVMSITMPGIGDPTAVQILGVTSESTLDSGFNFALKVLVQNDFIAVFEASQGKDVDVDVKFTPYHDKAVTYTQKYKGILKILYQPFRRALKGDDEQEITKIYTIEVHHPAMKLKEISRTEVFPAKTDMEAALRSILEKNNLKFSITTRKDVNGAKIIPPVIRLPQDWSLFDLMLFMARVLGLMVLFYPEEIRFVDQPGALENTPNDLNSLHFNENANFIKNGSLNIGYTGISTVSELALIGIGAPQTKNIKTMGKNLNTNELLLNVAGDSTKASQADYFPFINTPAALERVHAAELEAQKSLSQPILEAQVSPLFPLFHVPGSKVSLKLLKTEYPQNYRKHVEALPDEYVVNTIKMSEDGLTTVTLKPASTDSPLPLRSFKELPFLFNKTPTFLRATVATATGGTKSGDKSRSEPVDAVEAPLGSINVVLDDSSVAIQASLNQGLISGTPHVGTPAQVYLEHPACGPVIVLDGQFNYNAFPKQAPKDTVIVSSKPMSNKAVGMDDVNYMALTDNPDNPKLSNWSYFAPGDFVLNAGKTDAGYAFQLSVKKDPKTGDSVFIMKHGTYTLQSTVNNKGDQQTVTESLTTGGITTRKTLSKEGSMEQTDADIIIQPGKKFTVSSDFAGIEAKSVTVSGNEKVFVSSAGGLDMSGQVIKIGGKSCDILTPGTGNFAQGGPLPRPAPMKKQ